MDRLSTFVLRLLAVGVLAWAAAPAVAEPPTDAAAGWHRLISAEELRGLDPGSILLVDVRSEQEYAQGHLPGAINVPGKHWRTPSAKPDAGPSQYIFRKSDDPDAPDLAQYEALLSAAGIRNDHHVVVYGAHAGRNDGSVPAYILDWLGHPRVQFLDGVGVEQWTAAGGELSTQPRTLPPSQYRAAPIGDLIWSTADVLAKLDDPGTVFVDTRSVREFTGEDPRDNQRGGRIPGAVHLNYEDLLRFRADRTTLTRAEVARILTDRQITPERTVVLYCQTATRTSLPYLLLRDLGFPKVVIYDASWHEYGNRPNTPVVTGPVN